MRDLSRYVMLVFLAACSGDQQSVTQKQEPSSETVVNSNGKSCDELLFELSHAFSDRDFEATLSLNHELNIDCDLDSLMFLTNQLAISQIYYDDADSVLHYLKQIWRRPDRKTVWQDSELILSFALTFDILGKKDSACVYFQILEERGLLDEYNQYYSQRLEYCR